MCDLKRFEFVLREFVLCIIGEVEGVSSVVRKSVIREAEIIAGCYRGFGPGLLKLKLAGPAGQALQEG